MKPACNALYTWDVDVEVCTTLYCLVVYLTAVSVTLVMWRRANGKLVEMQES